jgi:hypothetical protein
MDILFPEPRDYRRNRTWVWPVVLCVPPALALIGVALHATGIWGAAYAHLAGPSGPAWIGTAVASPLIAAVIGAVAAFRGVREGAGLDRRLVVLAIAAAVLAVTGSAALLFSIA